jgi:uncharacterized protein YlzI (FlbEa/FlbD family)
MGENIKESEDEVNELVTKFYQSINLLGQRLFEEVNDEE